VTKRRPVWVCIPLTYSETTVGDPDDDASYVVREPVTWSITKCPGGKGQTEAVRSVLTRHQIDPTNVGDIIMLRAEPLEFEVGQQLFVRF
jgi:hypothetical protein